MIGQLKGSNWRARLTDKGKWKCDDKIIELSLNYMFPVSDYSPSHGVFGRKLLMDAGKKFKVEVIPNWDNSATQASDPNIIY